MKRVGIYCIENTINNKKYIGSSINIKQRLRQHRNQLNYNVHGNKHLNSSWNKYGSNTFKFYIVEECDINNVVEREKYYIELYKTLNPKFGYNKASKIENTSGYKWPEESRKRFSEWCKNNRKLSKETRIKISEANKRRVYNKGYKLKLTEEQRINRAKNKFKIVLQYDLEGNFIKEWESIKSIGEYYNKTTSSVSACCRNVRKHALGYKWKFKNDAS